MTAPLIQPLDEYNQRLVENVHPAGWTNPTPEGPYNLVVIGAGTAGLVTAAVAAGLGAKVALIERHLMGGDCLNVGCVPSKAVISSARAAAAVRDAEEQGVGVGGWGVDFPTVMTRMRRLRASIAHVDSAERFKSLGVDVFIGEASFDGEKRLRVGDQVLKFSRAVIATGARAVVPDNIPGLTDASPLTNETVFELTERPERMLVIGGGPIGCELAQAFQRLGTQVLLAEKSDRLLGKDDPDASQIAQDSLARDGVWIFCNSKVNKIEQRDGRSVVFLNTPEGIREEAVDRILVGTGRKPNVESLNLESVGVHYDLRHGIDVDNHLQTANPAIFAAGDVCSKYKFTHAADFMARTVVQNALVASHVKLAGWKKVSDLIIPHATYTSPEVAGIGLTESAAAEQGVEVDVYRVNLADVDRAILEGQTEGFVKVLTAKGSDRIVGGTIVAEKAGDMIATLSIAMTQGISLGSLASCIFPYPTQAEAVRKCGDLYNKSRLTPLAKSALEKFTSWTR